MCEEESDDTEAVAKLFEINDSIHRTLERYRLTKKGDLDGAARIPKGTLGTSGAGVKHGANNELSLIDFGAEEESQSQNLGEPMLSSAPAPQGRVEDDLLGLSLNEGPVTAAGPGIQLTSNFSSCQCKYLINKKVLLTHRPYSCHGLSKPDRKHDPSNKRF